jgi:hypothetical protein
MKFRLVFWDVLPCKIIVIIIILFVIIILHGSTSQKTNFNFM